MTFARSLVSILSFAVVASSIAACSAAGEGAESTDEAYVCRLTCDAGPAPKPTSGATCPTINTQCTVKTVGWGNPYSTWAQPLIGQNCKAPILWSDIIPNRDEVVAEYLSLCPDTPIVTSWVAAHPEAAKVKPCDACLPAAGAGSVWVRLTAPFDTSCSETIPPITDAGTPVSCRPSCPSACPIAIW